MLLPDISYPPSEPRNRVKLREKYLTEPEYLRVAGSPAVTRQFRRVIDSNIQIILLSLTDRTAAAVVRCTLKLIDFFR